MFEARIVLGGTHYMTDLMAFISQAHPLAFLQAGGGAFRRLSDLRGAVLHQDLGEHDVPLWSWFCQITDATASYGGYSGTRTKKSPGQTRRSNPEFNIQVDAASSCRSSLATFLTCEAQPSQSLEGVATEYHHAYSAAGWPHCVAALLLSSLLPVSAQVNASTNRANHHALG